MSLACYQTLVSSQEVFRSNARRAGHEAKRYPRVCSSILRTRQRAAGRS